MNKAPGPEAAVSVFFRGIVAYYVSLALTITSNNFHVKLFSVAHSTLKCNTLVKDLVWGIL